MNEEQSSSNHNTYFQQSWIVREYFLFVIQWFIWKRWRALSIFDWSSSSRKKQFSSNDYKCSQWMYETCNDFLMKIYMASFTKFMICKNTWKFVRICKFEWWKLLIEEGYLNLKICTIYNVTNTSSFMPFDMKRSNAIMKEYHLNYVQKTKENMYWFAGNRFQLRQNPVPSERYNPEFKNNTQEPVPL